MSPRGVGIHQRAKLTQTSLPESGIGASLHRFWFTQWGMDWLYDKIIVTPYTWLANFNRNDFIDMIYNGTASLVRFCHNVMSETQTGQLRWYATTVAFGLLILITIGVVL